MCIVCDLLECYNNLDVKPFLMALEHQIQICKQESIDMSMHAISLPGLTVHWMFRTLIDRPCLGVAHKARILKGVSGHLALKQAAVDCHS